MTVLLLCQFSLTTHLSLEPNVYTCIMLSKPVSYILPQLETYVSICYCYNADNHITK